MRMELRRLDVRAALFQHEGLHFLRRGRDEARALPSRPLMILIMYMFLFMILFLYRVLLGFVGFCWVMVGFFWVLLGFRSAAVGSVGFLLFDL